jgi:hypothetical protein
VGRQADACTAVFEALELYRESGSTTGIVSVIVGLSFLTRWGGRYEDALRPASAADALRERAGGRAPTAFLAGFIGDPEAEARAHLPTDDANAPGSTAAA